MSTSSTYTRIYQICGFGLILAGVLSLIGMHHHPYSTASNTQKALQDIVHFSNTTNIVHGMLILIIVLYMTLFLLYSQSRNLEKPLVASGLCLFMTGSILLIGAAVFSGFISPGLANSYINHPEDQIGYFEAVLELCYQSNQALAKLGSIGWLTSCLFWSIEIYSSNKAEKVLSLLGIFLSTMTGIALITGYLQLSVLGMTIITAVIAIWSTGLGALLISKSIRHQ